MTENAGAAVAMAPILKTVGTVGAPLPCTEVKLIDVAEMDYTSEDRYPGTKDEFDQQVSFKGAYDPAMANCSISRRTPRNPLDPCLMFVSLSRP